MERTTRSLTTRDIVLLIVHAADDQVGGRVVMQKLAYFSALRLKTRLDHRAHFYGPYSGKVEDAIGNAVLAGELRETVERIPDWYGGPDVLKYTYDLLPTGEHRVDGLIEEYPSEWHAIRSAVDDIRTALPDLNQKTLSAAAKTFLIVSESGGAVAKTDIPDLARRLGWHLEADEVEGTVSLLKRLNLVKAPS